MQKIVISVTDVALSTAITMLTHLQSDFPDSAEVQKVVSEALPVLDEVQAVVKGLFSL